MRSGLFERFTWAEIAEARRRSFAVRQQMRAAGFIGAEESVFERLENLNWTLAEKKDAVRYASGQIVEFHRMTKSAVRDGKRELKFLSGEQWRVKGMEGDSLIIERTAPRKNYRCPRQRIFPQTLLRGWP